MAAATAIQHGSVLCSSLNGHAPVRASRLLAYLYQCVKHPSLKCKAQKHQKAVVQRPIEVSRSIAAARVTESSRPDCLFSDSYAAVLCNQEDGSSSSTTSGSASAASSSEAQQEVAMNVIATRYIDECLLNAMAATNVNSIHSGDYRQVVLLGDGMDTRPFRLLWPPGSLLFLVAPAEVHEQAEALLATSSQPPHVMRGCLLRRVNMNLSAAEQHAATAAAGDARAANAAGGAANPDTDSCGAMVGKCSSGDGTVGADDSGSTVFMTELLKAGFRADRLSVWVLQGLHNQSLNTKQLQSILTEVTNCAAFHSLLVGELPGPISKRTVENLLADAGLLGAVLSHQAADQGEYGRWQEVAKASHFAAGDEATALPQQQQQQPGSVAADRDVQSSRWLCTGQQLRLSLNQMGVYKQWSTEFEESDAGDDFIGNFS
eukprot:GHRR01030903.1.p1 GENE.GHRR01030903.1~~GHRR01030903.1.p1  ORF type:complete len:432 (+),score=161.51 GHRR01030903.1:347-1642(+)